jgi:hypothetical protein
VAPQTYLSILTFFGLMVGLAGGLISQLTQTSVDVAGSKEKKLTSFGKLALAISVIGFAGSFASELLKSGISAQEARDSANEKLEDKKWKQRADALSEEILAKTDTSLQKSNQELEAAVQTKLAVTESRQEVLSDNLARTHRILETIWTESNRVNPANVAVQIKYTYLHPAHRPPPPLFESNWILSIRGLAGNEAKNLIANRWSSSPLITEKDADLSLIATDQRIAAYQYGSSEGVSFQQISHFAGFGGQVGPLNTITAWNGATIEVHLTARWPDLTGVGASTDYELEALKRYYDMAEVLARPDYSIRGVPVEAELTLFLKDRPIATSRATLVAVKEYDEDARGLVVGKFRLMRIKEDTFPRFEAAGQYSLSKH